MTPRLLIVDDEPAVLAALRRSLRRRFGDRIALTTESDAIGALALVKAQAFEIVISDLRMPAIDGISFLTLVAGMRPASVRMVLTGSADFETAQRAINESGAFRYLTKPWHDNELAAHIEAALAIVPASGPLSPQEAERRRIEALDPGITRAAWGPEGELLLTGWPELDAQGGTPTRH